MASRAIDQLPLVFAAIHFFVGVTMTPLLNGVEYSDTELETTPSQATRTCLHNRLNLNQYVLFVLSTTTTKLYLNNGFCIKKYFIFGIIMIGVIC